MYISYTDSGTITSMIVIGGRPEGDNVLEMAEIPAFILAAPMGMYSYDPANNRFYQNPDYTPPPPPGPDIEGIKTAKIAQIKALCAEKITQGFEADILGRGPLRYTLTQTQQEDLKVLSASVQAGAPAVLWHDSSRVMHEQYSASQFVQLYQLATAHAITCKLHSDGLEQLAVNLATADSPDIQALEAIHWDTELPPEIQAVVDAQTAMMLGGGGNT